MCFGFGVLLNYYLKIALCFILHLDYDKYPGSEIMKAAKPHLPKGGLYSYPSPDECILDMINSQLQVTSEL